MLKRIMLIVMALLLAVSCFCNAVSEDELSAEEEALETYVQEAKESGRTFTIPVHVGPIYSIIVRKDGVGIVFNMIGSRTAELGLQAVSFAMDLEEIDISLENGTVYTIPAVVQIQTLDVGSFITLNITTVAANALLEMLNSNSPVVGFSFIHSDGSKTNMTVSEVNDALSEASGSTVDIVNQALSAVSQFGLNVATGIGQFAGDAYSVAEKAIVDAGDAIAGAAYDVGSALEDAANSAGEFVGGALDSASDALNDAAESVGNLWNSLWGN